jgi:hypothetical protein
LIRGSRLPDFQVKSLQVRSLRSPYESPITPQQAPVVTQVRSTKASTALKKLQAEEKLSGSRG